MHYIALYIYQARSEHHWPLGEGSTWYLMLLIFKSNSDWSTSPTGVEPAILLPSAVKNERLEDREGWGRDGGETMRESEIERWRERWREGKREEEGRKNTMYLHMYNINIYCTYYNIIMYMYDKHFTAYHLIA